jgi:hypothetical protein
MPEKEVYVSTDVETNGPIPGLYSMLSFASAAYLADKTLVGTYAANLELLPDASEDPKTMAFWKNEPAAWEAARQDVQSPEKAMAAYITWLKSLPGKPVFVAYPLGYDFTFVYWYLMRFAGESPFGHNGIDVRSYAMAMLKKGYKDSGKSDMPRSWFDDLPHTHSALDDAIEQGALFCNMLSANTK